MNERKVRMDKYQKKFVREIKEAKTVEMLAFIVDRIYEDGFMDGHGEGLNDANAELHLKEMFDIDQKMLEKLTEMRQKNPKIFEKMSSDFLAELREKREGTK